MIVSMIMVVIEVIQFSTDLIDNTTWSDGVFWYENREDDFVSMRQERRYGRTVAVATLEPVLELQEGFAEE
jgi:hypothetical protein